MRPDVEKVIILLTDGLNTQNRFTTVPSQIDARTAAVCANIKVANIKMYAPGLYFSKPSPTQRISEAMNALFSEGGSCGRG